jgi:hypothetical protein
VNLFGDSIKMLNEVALIRQQARRGIYDKAIKEVGGLAKE